MSRTTIILILLASVVMGAMSMQKDVVVIPKEAIRFRVIANSNNEKDQKIKKKVATSLKQEVFSTLSPKYSLEKSREVLKQKLTKFDGNVQNTLNKNQCDESYTIDYGKHYFPEKNYKGVVYEEGMYESLVVTLGEGKGENFWCVLFPPLCLLDTEEENSQEIEYKSFVQEMINKYFQ